MDYLTKMDFDIAQSMHKDIEAGKDIYKGKEHCDYCRTETIQWLRGDGYTDSSICTKCKSFRVGWHT